MSRDIESLVREVARRIATETPEAAPAKRCLDHMTLADAKALAERVEACAREMGVNAVVAVADAGGNLTLCECMDNSYLASRDIAINKAYTSVALKMSTAKLAVLAAPGGPLYGIQHTNDGRIVIFGGGDPLESCGRIVGGVGVSGGSAEQDTALSAYAKQVYESL